MVWPVSLRTRNAGAHDPGRLILPIALALGLAVRLAILFYTPTLGTPIVDEQHYSRLASNLLAGNGFASGAGQLTSIRPPLYPGFLAAVWSVAGPLNFQAVRICQCILALATSALVYLLGARTHGTTVARLGAALCWLYPSLIFFNVLILTETLFTFLLALFLLLAATLVQTPRAATAVGCGLALGLAALTRSVLWPLPFLLCPLLAILIRERLTRRLVLSALVLAGYAVVVGPWAVRNTRLQGVVTIVDTMGGMNLRMGNYEYTPEDRMWDAVSIGGDKSWVYGLSGPAGQVMTEGKKEKWAQRKALEYMRAHPTVTLRRAFIKFADFWGLEREFIAGVQNGLFGAPLWLSVGGAPLIIGIYVCVVTVGAAGIWLAPSGDKRLQVVLLLPVVFIVAAHTIVFGHPRYHLPLIPILGLYAAATVTSRIPSPAAASRPRLIAVTATVTALVAIWIRQVTAADLGRIMSLLNHGG